MLAIKYVIGITEPKMNCRKFQWLHPDKRLDPRYYSHISPRFAAILILETNYEDLKWIIRSIIKSISFSKKIFKRGSEYFDDINPCIHITRGLTNQDLPENCYVVIMQNITNEISKTFIAETLGKGVECGELKIWCIDLAYGPYNEKYQQYDIRKTGIRQILTGNNEYKKMRELEKERLKLIDLNLEIMCSLKLPKYVNPERVSQNLFRKKI